MLDSEGNKMNPCVSDVVPPVVQEFIERYSEAKPSPFLVSLMERLNNCNSRIGIQGKNQFIPKQQRTVYMKEEDTLVIQHINSTIQDAVRDMLELGESGAFRSIQIRIYELYVTKRKCTCRADVVLYQQMLTNFVLVQKLLSKLMRNYDGPDKIYKLSSPKVLKLIEIVKRFKSVAGFKGVIFARRRFVANTLCHIFKDLAEVDPDMKFVIPDFVISMPAKENLKTMEELLECKWVLKAFTRFNLSKPNLLFSCGLVDHATLPKCTLVLRFDENMGNLTGFGDSISLIQEESSVNEVTEMLSAADIV